MLHDQFLPNCKTRTNITIWNFIGLYIYFALVLKGNDINIS